MATLTIELPPQPVQTELNLRRWIELLADPGPAESSLACPEFPPKVHLR